MSETAREFYNKAKAQGEPLPDAIRFQSIIIGLMEAYAESRLAETRAATIEEIKRLQAIIERDRAALEKVTK